MRAGKDNLYGNPDNESINPSTDESLMDAPLNYNDRDDVPGAIITWQLPRKDNIPDDEIIFEEDNIPDDEIIFEEEVDSGQAFIDEFGRPYTITRGVDPFGKPMMVESHTDAEGNPYTVENRVSRDGRPYSIEYGGEWDGTAWRFDPTKLPKWKQDIIGRDFLRLCENYLKELENDPERKAEFEEKVKELKKRGRKKKK